LQAVRDECQQQQQQLEQEREALKKLQSAQVKESADTARNRHVMGNMSEALELQKKELESERKARQELQKAYDKQSWELEIARSTADTDKRQLKKQILELNQELALAIQQARALSERLVNTTELIDALKDERVSFLVHLALADM
jgi:chromosome segregation ATPase